MNLGPSSFVLLGHPVGHSLSPAIHHAAYLELGLSDRRYSVVDCPDPESVRRQFEALRRGAIAGANVTVPWKRLALELADDADASAKDTGAANVLRPMTTSGVGRVVAHNTDVPALAEELRRGRPSSRAATVIGNGGAALAAVVACRALGMERVTVVARKWHDDADAPWPGAEALRARGGEPVAWPSRGDADSSFRRAIVASDVIVQSTTDGMDGASDGTAVRDLVPWAALERAPFVYDVVYNPGVTPIVAAARAAGLTAQTGLGMLVGQAALAIELWLGQRPREAPLRAAAERALAEKLRR